MRFGGWKRAGRLPDEVKALPFEPGEKPLAGCLTVDGTPVAGTRNALHLGGAESVRVPWEQVERADWDEEESRLTVVEVGTWGEVRPRHVLELDNPGRLLELLRERVTASIVLQRHVRVHGSRGVHVIARRAPGSDQQLTWVHRFDEGVDPDDPEVRRLAEQGLRRAQEETGL